MRCDGYTVDIEGAFDIMSCVTDYMCSVCLGFWGVPCVGALLRVLNSTCTSVGVSSSDAAVASRSAELLILTGFERGDNGRSGPGRIMAKNDEQRFTFSSVRL